MTYEQARRLEPTSLEEALEKIFWRQSGAGLIGAGHPYTWASIAETAREWLRVEAGRLKRQLAESQQEHLATQAKLANARRALAELRADLASVCGGLEEKA
jgi:hypothetical protein